MTTVYKLTDRNLKTHNNYQWALEETRKFSGIGELCGSGWCHAYTHPFLAVLLNPIHANFVTPRLFEAEGVIGKTDDGLKVGCSTLRLLKELPVPAITTEHRVHFAILCALSVYNEPFFVTWAETWMSGTNLSKRAAKAAAKVAAKAARAAEAAAKAAAWTAAGAAAAAARAAEAAAKATGAAEWAATNGRLNLIEIATAVCADLVFKEAI